MLRSSQVLSSSAPTTRSLPKHKEKPLYLPHDKVLANHSMQAKIMASADQGVVMHLFPLFPREIQLKIWRYSFPGGRAVNITYDPNDDDYKSNAIPPVALFVCKQSREEAKRFWQLTFGSTIDNGRIWFSFEIDQVLFMNPCGWTKTHNCGIFSLIEIARFVRDAKGVENIKVLAVHIKIAIFLRECEAEESPWLLGDFYPAMPCLEQLWEVAIFSDSDYLDDGASGFVISNHNVHRVPGGDLSLVRYITARQRLDGRQEGFALTMNNFGILWCQALMEYRGRTVIVANQKFRHGYIRPIIQLDRKRGLQDPILYKVIDDKLMKRFSRWRYYARRWGQEVRRSAHL
jgi:hypothetical protein